MSWHNPPAIYILSSCDVKYFHCVQLFFFKGGRNSSFSVLKPFKSSQKSRTHNSTFRFTIINQLVTKINFKTYFKVPIIWVLLFPSVIFKDKFRVLKSSGAQSSPSLYHKLPPSCPRSMRLWIMECCHSETRDTIFRIFKDASVTDEKLFTLRIDFCLSLG